MTRISISITRSIFRIDNMRIIFYLSMLLPALCHGQDFITVSGTVVGAESGSPLAPASVAVRHTSLGTITNELGKFTLHIPVAYRDSMIIITMLGYKKVEMSIANFPRLIGLEIS